MATTHCHKQAKDGVMDMAYIERRLDMIEARIDDLCGLLGAVLESVGLDSVETKPAPVAQLRLIGPNDGP